MKSIIDPKTPRRFRKEIREFINEVYGDTVQVALDNSCIEKYELFLENGKPHMINVVYNKLKVMHKDGSFAYWPIISQSEEFNLEAGLKQIQGLT